MSTPSAAVIGVGRMGRRHFHALAAIGAEVVAFADSDPSSLAEAIRMAPRARPYDDGSLLLEEQRPDLLCLATTATPRATIAMAAARSGVQRILCEKPLANSIRAAREVVRECRLREVRLVVNHWRRLFGPYQRILSAIEAGRFGDLRFMRVTCGAAGLANIGTHAFDLMRWFCGRPIAVTGYLDEHVPPNPRGSQFHDPGGHGLVEFEGGRRATFDFSNDFSTSFLVEFGLRYGRILVDERLCEMRAFARRAEDRELPLTRYQTDCEPVALAFGPAVDLTEVTASMARNALSDAPPACDGEDGLAALEMCAAVHLSAARRHVSVELPVEDDGGCLARIP